MLLLWFSAISNVNAQYVLWSSKVSEFSSQFGYRQYSANQVTGKPNILPNLGLSPNAWSPKHKRGIEFIKVAFDSLIIIQQIAVAEVHNPGGITHIYAYDERGEEHLIVEFSAKHIPIEGRLFRYFFEPTSYHVSSIKIVIDGGALPGHFGIDAIGISNSNKPITVLPNIIGTISTNNHVEFLGPNINSEFNELRPIMSSNGKTMYFSRQNHPENIGGVKDKEDIWYSTIDSTGTWSTARNIGYPLNTKGPNFVSSVNAFSDTTILLLGNHYYGRHKMAQGLSISRSSGNHDSSGWNKPKQIHINNDHNKSDKANYFLTADGQTLLMSLERMETHGSRDIYVSFKDEDSWSIPKNLGTIINSADEEAAPFLAADGQTLFFASKGFSGFGGYDIYLSRRLDNSWLNWSEPENLGSTFNSPLDDLFFNYVNNEDELAYFVRGTKDNTDIVKIKLPYFLQPKVEEFVQEIFLKIHGNVYNKETLEPLVSSIEFVQTTQEIQLVSSSPDSGYYEIMLNEGHLYSFEAKTEGYHPFKDSIDLTQVDSSIEIKRDIYLEPLKKNIPIVMDHVNFDFDSYELRVGSHSDLNPLVQLLFDNPKIKVKISGHTCDIGTLEYNQNLSHKRAESIAQFILNQGINLKRVAFQGYGESTPIASNEHENTREVNRRVEFVIVEDGKEKAISKPKSLEQLF